jgi:hypothetical protein
VVGILRRRLADRPARRHSWVLLAALRRRPGVLQPA